MVDKLLLGNIMTNFYSKSEIYMAITVDFVPLCFSLIFQYKMQLLLKSVIQCICGDRTTCLNI